MPQPEQLGDVFFNRSCPVCGRLLRIRVQLLGRRVYCQHCGGGFTATDESLGRDTPVSERIDELIARAEALLERAACGGDAEEISG